MKVWKINLVNILLTDEQGTGNLHQKNSSISIRAMRLEVSNRQFNRRTDEQGIYIRRIRLFRLGR